MADEIRYSDFIIPDDSITNLIQQLEQVRTSQLQTMESIKKSASEVEAALKKVNSATEEGRAQIKSSVTQSEKLESAQKKLAESMQETGKQLADLKVQQREQNEINKLTAILNNSQETSYNKLSAQYRLNKIELNKMTQAEREGTKEGRKLTTQSKELYAEMNRLQKETGKYTLQVGNYEISANKLAKTLAKLRIRQREILQTQTKSSRAYILNRNEIKKTQGELKKLTAEQYKSNKAVRGLIGNMRMLTASYLGFMAILGTVRTTVNELVEFERQLSSLKAISGATSVGFEAMKNQAEELGRETTKTATQVASLQTEYAKLGYSTTEILNATRATILLSEATEEDVTKAAISAGTTIRAFNLDASETQRVVDVMANSFTNSALNLTHYTESMKYVAPIARAANVSLEETSAIMSVLADNGIKGSMAGTSLRRILSEIDATGKPLIVRLRELAARGISLADANDEVGRRAQTSLLVMSEYTDKIATLTTQYERAQGSAEAMAKIQRDNVKHATDLLISAWTGLTQKWTEGSNVMRTTVDSFTKVIKWITRNVTAIKFLVKGLTLAAIAWGTYRVSLLIARSAVISNIGATYADIAAKGLMTTATNAATGAVIAFNAAIRANPLGILVTVITAAASAMLLFGDNTDDASKRQKTLNEEIEDTNRLISERLFNKIVDATRKYQKEIITLPNGVQKLVTKFKETGDIVETLRKAVRTMQEKDLKRLSTYFSDIILKAKRTQQNAKPGSLISAVEAKRVAQYSKYLDIISDEEERIKKLRSEDTGAAVLDEKDLKRIRELLLSIMQKGREKDLEKLKDNYKAKKVEFKKYGLSIAALNTWYRREQDRINQYYDDKERKARERKEREAEAERRRKEREAERERKAREKAALKGINDTKALTLSEIALMKKTEAEKTKLMLKAEQDRLKKLLELIQKGTVTRSTAEIKIIKNQIKLLERQMADTTKGNYDLYSLFGLNLSDEQKDAIDEATKFAVGQVNAYLQARIQAAEQNVQIAAQDVANAQNVLNAEIEARNNGYANNAEMARKDLALAKKNQDRALAERAKAQKAQLLMDAIVQASSLVTASAKIWAQLPFPWAIPALAVMWGSFAFSKVKASQLTSNSGSKTYGDGGIEFLSGGSHQSGNDINIGKTADGKQRKAEGGEAMVIVNRRSTSKYRKILPQLVNSLNGGSYDAAKFMDGYESDKTEVTLNSDKTDLSALEQSVDRIAKQGDKKYYTDGRGRTVEVYKNLKRIYNE